MSASRSARRTSRPASTSATSASIVPQRRRRCSVRGDARLGEVERARRRRTTGATPTTSSSETGKRVLVLDAARRRRAGARDARRTMSRMPLRAFTTSADERVLAGVCAGIAQALGVDVTLVRLVFALLALAGGAGIVLYLALWAWSVDGRPRWAIAPARARRRAPARCARPLRPRRRGHRRSSPPASRSPGAGAEASGADAPLSYGGLALAGCGAVLLLPGGSAPDAACSPRAPSRARCCSSAGPGSGGSRSSATPSASARIRTRRARRGRRARPRLGAADPGAHPAARGRAAPRRRARAAPGARAARLAVRRPAARRRRPPRSSRRSRPRRPTSRSSTASASSSRARATAPPTTAGALVLAAREAMTNAAKFAGVEEIDVYAEVTDDEIAVFVRDRGAGFDPRGGAGRPAGAPRVDRGPARARRRQRRSSRARPAQGTEVELRLPEATEARASSSSTITASSSRASAPSSATASRSSARPGTVADAVPLIKELDPDVVLLDVHLPDGSGDAIINAVAPERPGVKFLALSVSDAAEDVIAVIRAGARGYVTKTICGRRARRRRSSAWPRAMRSSRRGSPASCSTRSAPATRSQQRRARRADAARARGAPADRARLHVQGDRGAAAPLRQDRGEPRLERPAQAAAVDPPRADPLGDTAPTRLGRSGSQGARQTACRGGDAYAVTAPAVGVMR